MNRFQLVTEQKFKDKLASYPPFALKRLAALRTLVHEVAAELDGVVALCETLKWGEPAFTTKRGTTLRMDWKAKQPDQYAFYVSCNSRLIPTFRVVFGEELRFNGDRAVIFDVEDTLPVEAVKTFIEKSLTYHQQKHLPLMGL